MFNWPINEYRFAMMPAAGRNDQKGVKDSFLGERKGPSGSNQKCSDDSGEGKDGQVAQDMNRNRDDQVFFDLICDRKEDPAYYLGDRNRSPWTVRKNKEQGA